jgi:hypothetical protein
VDSSFASKMHRAHDRSAMRRATSDVGLLFRSKNRERAIFPKMLRNVTVADGKCSNSGRFFSADLAATAHFSFTIYATPDYFRGDLERLCAPSTPTRRLTPALTVRILSEPVMSVAPVTNRPRDGVI